VAALGAFDGIDELEAIKASYARNRAMLLEELPRAGLSSILPADGAFYLYADISRFTGDSEAFAKTNSQGHRRRGHAGRRFRSGSRPAVMREPRGRCGRQRAASQAG
jgi:hypothetical protein